MNARIKRMLAKREALTRDNWPRRRKAFVAEWRDEDGIRHRLGFPTPEEADAHKQEMLALRMAKRLGLFIANGSRKGPERAKDVHRLTRKCSRIAHMIALEKISIEQPAQISA